MKPSRPRTGTAARSRGAAAFAAALLLGACGGSSPSPAFGSQLASSVAHALDKHADAVFARTSITSCQDFNIAACQAASVNRPNAYLPVGPCKREAAPAADWRCELRTINAASPTRGARGYVVRVGSGDCWVEVSEGTRVAGPQLRGCVSRPR